MSELQQIEDTMRRHDDPVVTVPELVDELKPEIDKSDTWVRDQLRLLERADAVESKTIGSRATAWWHVDRVTAPHLAPEKHPDQADLEESAAPVGVGETSGMLETETDGESDPAPYPTEPNADVSDVAEVFDPPGRGSDWNDRVDALTAMLERLRDAGEATSRELYQPIYESHDVHYASADGFWRNCGHEQFKRAREETEALELVDADAGRWRWVGGDE